MIVDIPDDKIAAIAETARLKPVQVIRRALAAFDLIAEAEREGCVLQIRHPDGRIEPLTVTGPRFRVVK